MKVLAFDTSNKTLSVALLENEQLVAETSLNIKKNHSMTLMPSIDFLVKSVEWAPSDLDRIVVADGPGSYTGLRMAVATAKTLAYTLKIDLVGVSSLLALVPELDGVVIPLVDARRNHVYAGFYENGRAVEQESYLAFEDVLQQATSFEQVTFVGEVEAFRSQIEAALPQARIQATLPQAYVIGLLGLEKTPQPIHEFVPRYLKRVEAEENWLKDHTENGQSYIKRL